MWIALNDAFLSIVEPKGFDLPKGARKLRSPLMVRARHRGDLKRHFPNSHIYEWKGRDYPFRCFVEREEVARVIGGAIGGIDYSNFKNSVHDAERHDAYMDVWLAMNRWQHGAYKRKPYQPDDREFAWGRGNSSSANESWRWGEDLAGRPVLDFTGKEGVACDSPGCTEANPCLECLIDALEPDDREDAELYGPFDSGDPRDDDAGAKSHLRVAPR